MPMGPKILLGIIAILLTILATRLARAKGDAPQRLLAFAVRRLPRTHREWGAAMTAELDRLHGRRTRWSFALSCARAALFPPRNPSPVLISAAATVAITVTAALATPHPIRPFATTLCAAIGFAATITLARSRKPTPPGKTAITSMATGAALAITTAVYLLTRYPTGHDQVHNPQTDGRNTGLLIAGAILLTGYLWLTLTPPATLAAHPRAATIGTVTGLIYAAGYLPANIFLGEHRILYYLLAPALLFTLAAARAGTIAALWAGLTGALWTFAIPILVHLNGYQLDALRLDDTEPGLTPDPQLWLPSLLGTDLGDGFFGLLAIPLWSLLLGLVGNAINQAGQAFRQEYA